MLERLAPSLSAAVGGAIGAGIHVGVPAVLGAGIGIVAALLATILWGFLRSAEDEIPLRPAGFPIEAPSFEFGRLESRPTIPPRD
jgi:hypothetical protein